MREMTERDQRPRPRKIGKMRVIHRFDKVVDVLGGPKKTCNLLGFDRQSGQAVHIWKKDQQFPAKHYFSIQYLLIARGRVASVSLFSFSEFGVPPAFKRLLDELLARSGIVV